MKTMLLIISAAVLGALLESMGFPHGLLLGSILASAVVVKKLHFSPSLRLSLGYVQIVLGISTGLMFESWSTGEAKAMLPSLGVLILCLSGQMVLAGLWLFKVTRWDMKDSLLAVYPGALAAIFDLLESERASSKVLVVHVIRLISITLLASVWVSGNAEIVSEVSAPLSLGTLPIVLSLVVTCLIFGGVLSRIGIPAPFMLTAILVTAGFVRFGFIYKFQMPQLSVQAASILLGVLIGAKFNDITFKEFVLHGRAGLISVALMLLTAAVFAGVAGQFLDHDPFLLWMAYMPGAIETLALVAFSGGLNVVFIMSHHLVRIVLLHFAPALIVRIRRRRIKS